LSGRADINPSSLTQSLAIFMLEKKCLDCPCLIGTPDVPAIIKGQRRYIDSQVNPRLAGTAKLTWNTTFNISFVVGVLHDRIPTLTGRRDQYGNRHVSPNCLTSCVVQHGKHVIVLG